MSKRYPGDIGEGINLLPRSRRPFRRNNEQRRRRRRRTSFGWVTRSRYVEPLSEVTIDRIIRDVCEFDRSYPSQISVISSNDCSLLYTSPVLQPRAELQRNRHDTADHNRG